MARSRKSMLRFGILIFKETKYKAWKFCVLCKFDVYCMVTTSKGMFLWHLQKYHSEDSSWLYRGLNVKASILCHEKVRSLIHKEFCGGQGRCSNCPEGYVFSATSDAWTTNNNINYTTCSVHFIDRSAWILHHFALRILKMTVFSNADVKVFGKQLILTISTVQCTAIVTDTDAIVCKPGCLFVSASFKLVEVHNGTAV